MRAMGRLGVIAVASRAERAKIFLPFAALDGLEEALAEAEQLAQLTAETILRVAEEDAEAPPEEAFSDI